jgi:hypothetical protein
VKFVYFQASLSPGVFCQEEAGQRQAHVGSSAYSSDARDGENYII